MAARSPHAADTPTKPLRVRPTLEIGDIVGGKYRIEQTLGTSGMGVVYRAVHLELEQNVAIKVLLEAASTDAQSLARFKREAKLLSRVRNDHVVRVIDVGTLNSGSPYIVMDCLDGVDLAKLMKVHGKLPLPFACDILMQTCEALAAAHAQGIVHRDLKPSNIFVSTKADGSKHVTVIDFGIAKLRNEDESGAEDITHTSVLVGSPRYMSPEQAQSSKSVDHRADVWALGIIFQEIVTGQRVFEERGVGATLMALATRPPSPLTKYFPEAPQELVTLVEWTLRKDPVERIGDVHAFAQVIAKFANTDQSARLQRIAGLLAAPRGPLASIDSATSMISLPPPASMTSASSQSIRPDSTSTRMRRAALVFAFVGVAIVAGVATAFVLARRTKTPASNVTSSVADLQRSAIAPAPSAAPAPSEIAPAAPSAEAAPTLAASAANAPTAANATTAASDNTAGAAPPAPTVQTLPNAANAPKLPAARIERPVPRASAKPAPADLFDDPR